MSQSPSFSGLSSLTDKLCDRDTVAARVARLPRPLVFTNGVFDVLHRGHVMYLAQARALGASLVVALNTDARPPAQPGGRPGLCDGRPGLHQPGDLV